LEPSSVGSPDAPGVADPDSAAEVLSDGLAEVADSDAASVLAVGPVGVSEGGAVVGAGCEVSGLLVVGAAEVGDAAEVVRTGDVDGDAGGSAAAEVLVGSALGSSVVAGGLGGEVGSGVADSAGGFVGSGDVASGRLGEGRVRVGDGIVRLGVGRAMLGEPLSEASGIAVGRVTWPPPPHPERVAAIASTDAAVTARVVRTEVLPRGW
jgi:hypothetical protein